MYATPFVAATCSPTEVLVSKVGLAPVKSVADDTISVTVYTNAHFVLSSPAAPEVFDTLTGNKVTFTGFATKKYLAVGGAPLSRYLNTNTGSSTAKVCVSYSSSERLVAVTIPYR